MKKAIFFDIDGTLIDASAGMTKMSEMTKQAIRQLQEAGHYTFIATGRPLAFLDEELLSFGFDGYILMNGAVVVLKDQVIYQKPLAKKMVAHICQVCDTQKIQYILQGVSKVYLPRHFTEMDDFYAGLAISKKDFQYEFALELLDVYKMEFIAQNDQSREICASFVTPDMYFMVDPRHNLNFELYAKAETKATGILHALQHLQIPVRESFAFGDGVNDQEMLQAVGCSMAMGNAEDSIKKLASYIVPAVKDEGVAKGIYQYIL